MNAREEKIQNCIKYLTQLYNQLPQTVGCEKATQPGGCGAWCCTKNTPSMFYTEFLYIWDQVMNTWHKAELKKLILRAIRNHLSNEVIKGCIFHNPVTLQCNVHEQRPLACRQYGIVPKDNWERRSKSLQNRYKNDPRKDDLLPILNQCNLVSTTDGKKEITHKNEKRWFKRTQQIESYLGVKQQVIQRHDLPGGSYRTMHDHVLMELFDMSFLTNLSQIKLECDSIQKVDEFIKTLEPILDAICQQKLLT